MWQYRVPPQYTRSAEYEHVDHAVSLSSTADGWIDFYWDDLELIERAFCDPAQSSWSRNMELKYIIEIYLFPFSSKNQTFC